MTQTPWQQKVPTDDFENLLKELLILFSIKFKDKVAKWLGAAGRNFVHLLD